jgi:hypothetical protein
MSFGYVTKQDDTGPTIVCTRVDNITSLTRLAYYAVKLVKILSEAP